MQLRITYVFYDCRLAEKQEVQQKYIDVLNHCKKLGEEISGYIRAYTVFFSPDPSISSTNVP